MELGGEFCLVCGSPPPLFGQRICEACFRERLQLVKIPKNINWSRCPRCQITKIDKSWVKVDDDWNQGKKVSFLAHIKQQVGRYYEDSICDCKLVKRKKLYGFDGGKKHKFILFKFENERAFNKVKNLWYTTPRRTSSGEFGRKKLNPSGYIFDYSPTYLYEANIPPLLRYFHIKEVSPSGWVAIPNRKMMKPKVKKTTCMHEIIVNYKDISEDILSILKSKRDEIVFKMKLTSKEETDILSKRIEKLEKKIENLEKRKKTKSKSAKRS